MVEFIKSIFKTPDQVDVAYYAWKYADTPYGRVECRDGKTYLMSGEEVDLGAIISDEE